MLTASRRIAKGRPLLARGVAGHYLYYPNWHKYEKLKTNLDVVSDTDCVAGFVTLSGTLDHNLLRKDVIKALSRAMNVPFT